MKQSSIFASSPLRLFASSIILFSFLLSLLRPPTGQDGLAYHLPFALHYWNNGLGSLPITPFAGNLSYFPATAELIQALFIGIPHSDILANLPQTLAWLGSLLLVYFLIKKLGNKDNALIALLMACLIPEYLFQATSSYVDIIYGFFLLLAIFWGLEKDNWRTIGSGTALGLALGCKYFAVLQVVIVVIILLVYRFRGIKALFKDILIIGLLCLLVGGYWYVRNWVLTGNPFYPAQVSLGGFVLFSGSSGFFNTSQGQDTKILEQIQHIALPVALYIIYMFYYFLTKPKPTVKTSLVLLPLLLILSVVVMPFREVRYIFSAVFLGIALASALMDTRLKPVVYVYLALSVLLTLYRFYTLHLFMLVGLSAVFLVVIVLYLLISRSKGLPRKLIYAGFVLLLVAFIWFLPKAREYTRYRYFYTASMGEISTLWQKLDELMPKDTVIAYAADNRVSPLWGSNLEHKIVYAHVNGLGYVAAEPGFRSQAAKDVWITNLKDMKVQYFILSPEYSSEKMPMETQWLEDDTLFQSVWMSGNYRIYKLLF